MKSHSSCNIKQLSNREILSQTKFWLKKERDIHIKEALKKQDLKERGACQKRALPMDESASAPNCGEAVSAKEALCPKSKHRVKKISRRLPS